MLIPEKTGNHSLKVCHIPLERSMLVADGLWGGRRASSTSNIIGNSTYLAWSGKQIKCCFHECENHPGRSGLGSPLSSFLILFVTFLHGCPSDAMSTLFVVAILFPGIVKRRLINLLGVLR